MPPTTDGRWPALFLVPTVSLSPVGLRVTQLRIWSYSSQPQGEDGRSGKWEGGERRWSFGFLAGSRTACPGSRGSRLGGGVLGRLSILLQGGEVTSGSPHGTLQLPGDPVCWGRALGAAFRLPCLLPQAPRWPRGGRSEEQTLRVGGALRGRGGRSWGFCGHCCSAWVGARRPGFQDRVSLWLILGREPKLGAWHS